MTTQVRKVLMMAVSGMPTTPDRRDKWLVTRRAGAVPDTSIVCFPPAGGGATTYTAWRRWLPAPVELLAVELPGRESRFTEPPLTSSADVADRLAPKIAASAAPRLVLFGHSLGALLAFEVARRLCGPDSPMPALLIVSASRAPDLPSRMAGIADRPDAELVAELRRFGCDPAGALSDPEIAKLFLAPLRADLAMATRYTYDPRGGPLAIPVLALSGRSDLTCDHDDVEAWATFTTAGFTHRSFDGGHFFIKEHEAEVVTAVAAEIKALTAHPASGGWC